jgi:hypothetical protein
VLVALLLILQEILLDFLAQEEAAAEVVVEMVATQAVVAVFILDGFQYQQHNLVL